jgi:nitric oxide reductase NorE protein
MSIQGLSRAEPSRADDEAGRLPGDLNMWIFVLGDLVIFGVYFIVFILYRAHEQNLFLESQRHLSLATGAVNTLVLLAGSQFVVHGVRAARANAPGRGALLAYCAGLCGVLFAAVKAYEWGTEIRRGFTLPANDFFMFYYMLTGVHLFHVLLGVGLLAVGARRLRGPGPARRHVLEVAATYWHMVDLLWLLIFTLLYVMR